MNKQIKLLKDITATRYILNLSNEDLQLLWDSYVSDGYDIIEHLKNELKDDSVHCDLDFDAEGFAIVWIDYDFDCDEIRKNVETSISKFFKLIENQNG